MPISEPLILVTCNGCSKQTKRLLYVTQSWTPANNHTLYKTLLYDDEGITAALTLEGWDIDEDEDTCYCPKCNAERHDPLRYEYEYADMMEDEPTLT